MSQGSLSRVLADLSAINRNGGAGLGLVEQRSESTDRRIQTSRLTEKGKAMVWRIAAALRPSMTVPVRVAA
jgi:DNA-binding MarR family transcriptional regulator